MTTTITVKNGKARPVNPTKLLSLSAYSIYPLTDINKNNEIYAAFESTVQWHDCPEATEDGEFMGYLQWQAQNPINDGWYDCGPGYLTADTRQIWRIVSQPQEKKTEMKNSKDIVFGPGNDNYGEYQKKELPPRVNMNDSPVECALLKRKEANPVPQKEEAKTVEGKTPFEILTTFTGDDSFRLQQNHRNRIIKAIQAYSTQQNKALMESVIKILEQYSIEAMKSKSHAGDYAENMLYNIIEEIEALKPKP